jgi:hypothetical protein
MLVRLQQYRTVGLYNLELYGRVAGFIFYILPYNTYCNVGNL